MTKTQGWIIVGILVVVVLVGFFAYFASLNQQHTLPVLSDTTTYKDYSEYYLYVPGNKSTCTWTSVENGIPQSFTTQPDPSTGQQDYLYNSSVSDLQVTCVNDQGTEYVGQFTH